MTTAQARENKISSTQKVKKHLKDRRGYYITGLACLTVGAAGGFAVGHRGTIITLVDSMNTTLISWKSPHTHTSQTIVLGSNDNPSIPVVCMENHRVYPSQNDAARTLGVNASELSRHVRGLRESVGADNLHFVRASDLAKAQAEQAAA